MKNPLTKWGYQRKSPPSFFDGFTGNVLLSFPSFRRFTRPRARVSDNTTDSSSEESKTPKKQCPSNEKAPFSNNVRQNSDPQQHLEQIDFECNPIVPNPTSQHSYQAKDTVVIPLASSSQGSIILESTRLDDNERNTIRVKNSNDSSAGYVFVLLIYTLASLLFAICLFVFSIQVTLFLWIGNAITCGFVANQEWTVQRAVFFVGAVCSIPTFIFGMAKIMVRLECLSHSG